MEAGCDFSVLHAQSHSCVLQDFQFLFYLFTKISQQIRKIRFHSRRPTFFFTIWFFFEILCYCVLISVDLCKMKLKPWVNQRPQIWKAWSFKFKHQSCSWSATTLHFLKTLVKTHQCGMLCSWVNIQVFSDATWAQMCCYNSNPILPLLLAPAKSRAIKNKDLLYFTLLCSTMLG